MFLCLDLTVISKPECSPSVGQCSRSASRITPRPADALRFAPRTADAIRYAAIGKTERPHARTFYSLSIKAL